MSDNGVIGTLLLDKEHRQLTETSEVAILIICGKLATRSMSSWGCVRAFAFVTVPIWWLFSLH